jgi:hypothetical protein
VLGLLDFLPESLDSGGIGFLLKLIFECLMGGTLGNDDSQAGIYGSNFLFFTTE